MAKKKKENTFEISVYLKGENRKIGQFFKDIEKSWTVKCISGFVMGDFVISRADRTYVFYGEDLSIRPSIKRAIREKARVLGLSVHIPNTGGKAR